MSTDETHDEEDAGRLGSTLSGIAGEYFVAAELTRRGYIASLTLRNTDGVDILVANLDATKSVAIQVKTRQGTGKRWVVNKEAEERNSDNFFFVFVNLNNGGVPSYHVVQSRIVATRISKHHQEVIDRGGKDVSMRTFILESATEFLNQWSELGL
jgi:hypothetical protein